MAEHTPGPWEVAPDDDGPRHVIAVDGVLIATAYTYQRTKATVSANARLIAAAPSLLEACQAAVESANVNEGTVYTMHDKGRAAYEKLKAAIAAATDVQVSETGGK
mgnify:CR=1 FL=1